MNDHSAEDALHEVLMAAHTGDHPERYILGKPHPDRATQFKPFAALRGYDETVKEMALKMNEEQEAD